MMMDIAGSVFASDDVSADFGADAATARDGIAVATVAPALLKAIAARLQPLIGGLVSVSEARDRPAPDHVLAVRVGRGDRVLAEMTVSQSLVAALTDLSFGGTGAPDQLAPVDGEAARAVGMAALRSVAAAVIDTLHDADGTIDDLDPDDMPGGGMAATVLEFRFGGQCLGHAVLWQPFAEPVRPAPPQVSTGSWSVADAVPLKLSATIARPRLSLTRLSGLRIGDVIPLATIEPVVLSAGGVLLGTAATVADSSMRILRVGRASLPQPGPEIGPC